MTAARRPGRIDRRESVQQRFDRGESAGEVGWVDETAFDHGVNVGQILVEAAFELGERLTRGIEMAHGERAFLDHERAPVAPAGQLRQEVERGSQLDVRRHAFLEGGQDPEEVIVFGFDPEVDVEGRRRLPDSAPEFRHERAYGRRVSAPTHSLPRAGSSRAVDGGRCNERERGAHRPRWPRAGRDRDPAGGRQRRAARGPAGGVVEKRTSRVPPRSKRVLRQDPGDPGRRAPSQEAPRGEAVSGHRASSGPLAARCGRPSTPVKR